MDLVNLMYKYINKFINSKELLQKLKEIDVSLYNEEEVKDINKHIIDVENIVKVRTGEEGYDALQDVE